MQYHHHHHTSRIEVSTFSKYTVSSYCVCCQKKTVSRQSLAQGNQISRLCRIVSDNAYIGELNAVCKEYVSGKLLKFMRIFCIVYDSKVVGLGVEILRWVDIELFGE